MRSTPEKRSVNRRIATEEATELLAWVPSVAAVEQAGGVPDGVALAEWRGTDLPAGRDEVEFVVPGQFASTREQLLASLPRLRVVQSMSAGIDWLKPYVPAGVTLCDARGVHDTATAEWAVAAALACVREFPRFVRAQAARRWEHGSTAELSGATVLIVGYGSIGAAIERRLAPFDVTVLRVARRARDGVAAVDAVDALPQLLPRADVVVLVVPLTSETIGMVDARFLGAMKNGALLVNAARGKVVDTDALLAELVAGRLRAALDVTEPEPLPDDHPLWSAPGLFLTPHVAGSTSGLSARFGKLLRSQLARAVAGEPLANVVDGDY